MKTLPLIAALLLPAAAAAADEGFKLPPLAATQIQPATPARQIDRLLISGNQVLPASLLQALAAPWLGRQLDEAQIEALRQALTRAYIDRGYVNSGLLIEAQQDVAGALRLRAVEGRLSAIELRGLDGLNPEHVKARLQLEGPLNLEQLRERFQLLLGDPLLRRVQARLLPGGQPGEAVLAIEVERARPWQLSAFLHNHRPVSVGEWAAGLRGQLSNLSGQGDQLDATLLAPIESSGGGQAQFSLGWRLPLTAWALPRTQLQFGLEHSDAAVIEEPVRQLDIESRVRSLEFGVAQLLVETPAHKLSLGLQAQARRQQSSLLGEPFSFTPGLPDGRLRETLLRFWQEAQWRSEQQAVALRSSFGLGRNNLQAEAPRPGVEAAPARRFLFWTGQAQWVRKLDENGLQATLRGSAQIARDRLLALDGLAAGGVRTVRGHRENQLVRDEGWVLNLELERPFTPSGWDGARFVLLAFYDHARLRNRGQPWDSLSSVGVGLQAQWQGWSLDVVAAKRLDEHNPPPRDTALQDQGLHLQLGYRW